MRKNIGTPDRIIRASLGILLLASAVFWKSRILLACALFVFFEALLSWCLIYQWIGKNTCPVKK